MTAPLHTLDIRFENDLVSVRQHARQISSLLGFDEMDQARISTAVSEIARNALGHAHGGIAEFLVEEGESPQLLITVSDKGPGISDVGRVLEGRFTSAGGAGMGIASARRLVDTFAIDSTPGSGTTVVLGKRLAGGRAIAPDELARIARQLARRAPYDPYEEIRSQNHELVRAMEELRARQEDLVRLNRELEDTNRGVVALYAELDEKAIHLRRADELKTRFLSNMSHEFRTPLNSILALSRLLLDRVDGPLSEEQAKQLTFIQESAQDLSELVNDLLDIAKVEAGRITVHAAEMDVGNLFGGLRGMFRPLLTNSCINLVFEDPPPLPKMCTDEGKVSQILRNFISNALKFTERGEVRVAVRNDPENGRVVFAVADTGIGIAPEDHARIFQEFAQVDNPIQKRVKGTGLGLPLAKKLAQLLGGSIFLESRLGEGSTFYVSLPPVYPGGRAISEAEPRTEPDTTRFPVLIVEEDMEAATLYEKYLKRTGFQPLPAGSVAEARQIVRQIRPAAIILDVMTPAGATWDFLLEMKRDDQTREIPVLVISASDEAKKARALGADEFTLKPIDRSTLLSKLKRLARRAPAQTILIVDDDAISRYLLRELLADTRYELLEAADGREGIQIARERQPGAILLDLAMPGMSGFEVLDCLAADPSTRNLPVIIVTSKILDEEEERFLGGRAVAVVPKGLPSREEAVAALRAALAKAEAVSRPSQPEEARNVY